MVIEPIRREPPKRTLKDIGDLQDELSGSVSWFLGSLFDPHRERFNKAAQAVYGGWKEGQGNFAREVGWHIEAICDAVERAMKEREND